MGHPKTKFILRSEVGLVSGRGIFPAHTPKKINIEAENDALEYDFHLLGGCLVRFQPLIFPKNPMGVGQKTDPKPPPSAAGPGALWLGSPSPERAHQAAAHLENICITKPGWLFTTNHPTLFFLFGQVSQACLQSRCFMIFSAIIEMLHDFWGICLFWIASAITSNLKFTGHKSHQTKG